jgi:hypothetical protein
MLTKLDNYLNYTDVLEESRIVDLLELSYEDGITVEVLTNLIEELVDTLEANSIYDEAHDSADGTNTYYLNKEKVEVLNGINVAYIIEQYNLV